MSKPNFTFEPDEERTTLHGTLYDVLPKDPLNPLYRGVFMPDLAEFDKTNSELILKQRERERLKKEEKRKSLEEQGFFKPKEKHNFHLVDISQLPILAAMSSLLLVLNVVFYFHGDGIVTFSYIDNMTFQTSWMMFLSVLFAWFFIVLSESGRGHHTLAVRQGLRLGMVLFIASEVMFFFAFFWAFFHVSLSPAIAIGGIWPPKSIQALDVWGLPLVNTLLLLSSGLTITLSHRAMLKNIEQNSTSKFDKYLLLTILLGVIFLYCQITEYKYGITFRWKENIYGATFFVTTGFHGLHVTLGTIFLLFCLLRDVATASGSWGNSHLVEDIKSLDIDVKKLPLPDKIIYLPASLPSSDEITTVQNKASNLRMTKDQHLGFEMAAWYWHFVDVVWIFLFITIYWWGS